MKRSILAVMLLALIVCSSATSAEISELLVTDFTKFKTKLVKGENLVSKTVYHENGKNIVEFKYKDCKSGEYHPEFWICPAKHKDGTIEEFSVMVNNVPLMAKLKPIQTDWHAATLENYSTITFKDGENTIQIIGNGRNVPNIDVTEVSPNSKPIKIDETEYIKFNQQIKSNKLLTQSLKAIEQISTTTDVDPLANYTCYNKIPFSYTFHTYQYLEKGELFEVLTEKLNNYETIIYLFKNSNPEKYNWAIYPEDEPKVKPNDEPADEFETTELKVSIPESGFYSLYIKPLYNNEKGFCNILVNQDVYFENVPVTGGAVFFNYKNNTEYNTFTYSYSGDPIMMIENIKLAENPSGYISNIEAYNDDADGAYDEDDNSEWGLNSRIKRSYKTPYYKYVWVTSYSSLNPTGLCDLYLNCRNATDVLHYFKHLQPEDAICSANATFDYNCISWSGGITDYWEWPLSEDSQYYSEDPLEAFDNFYNSRGLTREGSNYYNGTVALWAYVYNGGDRWYTHASIRNGNGDGIAHGYSWESKAGPLERFFHPRNAVGGYGLNYEEGYGEIVEYYRPKNTIFNLAYSPLQNIQPQPINIYFNSEEETVIKEYINAIEEPTKELFEGFYNKFDGLIKESVHSNPNILKDCDEFEALMDFYYQHQECKYIIFDLLANNELAAILVMNEITNNDDILRASRKSVAKKVRATNKSNEYYPIQSNMMLNVKEYLKDNTSENIEINSPLQTEFHISVESGQIKLQSSEDFNNPISIQIFDQYGNLLDSKSNIHPVSSGKYIISDIISNAQGIVILKINTGDNIISKKLSL